MKMEKQIILYEESVEILGKVIYSGRKSIGIEILQEGELVIRVPFGLSKKKIEQIIEKKKEWIFEKHRLQKQRSEKQKQAVKPAFQKPEGIFHDKDEESLKKEALEYLRQRAEYYAKIMGVTYNQIKVKSQKTRWGSCSSKKNLNFNWKLIKMPKEIADYVVVHELAHLIEMNHSCRFWDIVEKHQPEYKACRIWLRENGRNL